VTQPTDRPGINHLTSDQLDRLYGRLDYLAGYAATLETYATEQRESAERAEATLAAVRALHERDPEADYCVVCSNHGDITWPCATVAVFYQHGQTPA
jgi:hypothetical protein